MMSCRACIVLPGDRGASDIAQRIAGDASRWRELVAVNPQKRRNGIGGFDYVADGERLALPVSWPDDPFSTLARMPRQSSASGARFESSRGGAGVLPAVTLPNGWVDDDLKAVIVMANDLGMSDPKSLTCVWASETGVSPQQQLNPRTKLDLPSSDPWSPFFAGGLNGSTAAVCRALGFKSASDWLNAPIRIQLQGIYKQYVNHVRAMGEGFDARANRLGTTAAALLYAFNFLPAYAVNLRSADQAIVSAGSVFYDQNCALDTSTSGLVSTRCGQKKGTITLRDFEMLTRTNRFPSGWPVYAINARLDAMRNDVITISSLGPTGSGVWDAMKGTWEALTGTAEKVDAPRVITDAPQTARGLGGELGLANAEQYWKATGVVIFAGFLVAWTQGWIKR
jgi:hypothetical protein